MKTLTAADTRRETAYNHCHALLRAMEHGRCNSLEGLVCVIKLIAFAESIKASGSRLAQQRLSGLTRSES